MEGVRSLVGAESQRGTPGEQRRAGLRGEGRKVRGELEKVERPPAWWGLAGRVSVKGRGPTEGSKKRHVWSF